MRNPFLGERRRVKGGAAGELASVTLEASPLTPEPAINRETPALLPTDSAEEPKKHEMPFVDDQGKEALNFQITVSLAVIVCAILMVVLIGMLLLPIVLIGALVLTVIAAIKANGGEAYRYPLALRLIK